MTLLSTCEGFNHVFRDQDTNEYQSICGISNSSQNDCYMIYGRKTNATFCAEVHSDRKRYNTRLQLKFIAKHKLQLNLYKCKYQC